MIYKEFLEPGGVKDGLLLGLLGGAGSEKEGMMTELNLEGWVGFFLQRKKEGALQAEGSV